MNEWEELFRCFAESLAHANKSDHQTTRSLILKDIAEKAQLILERPEMKSLVLEQYHALKRYEADLNRA